ARSGNCEVRGTGGTDVRGDPCAAREGRRAAPVARRYSARKNDDVAAREGADCELESRSQTHGRAARRIIPPGTSADKGAEAVRRSHRPTNRRHHPPESTVRYLTYA